VSPAVAKKLRANLKKWNSVFHQNVNGTKERKILCLFFIMFYFACTHRWQFQKGKKKDDGKLTLMLLNSATIRDT